MAEDHSGQMDIPQTPSQRRREARRLKDPHHAHPFKRMFLGPTPVQSNAAASVALAIAQDVKIEKPKAMGIVDRYGNVVTGRKTSLDSNDRSSSPKRRDEDEVAGAFVAEAPIRSNSSPPRMSRRNLSPLHIPHTNRLSPFGDRSGLRRKMSREASFTSAKSTPDSFFSDGHVPVESQRDRWINKKRSILSDTSGAGDLSYQEDTFATPTRSNTDGLLRRRESQSSHEPMHGLGRKKLSFEVSGTRDRRGRSEGSPARGGSILQRDSGANTYDTESTPKRLTALSVNEDGTSLTDITPSKTRQWHTLHPLRNTISNRSLRQAPRSPVGAHSLDTVVPSSPYGKAEAQRTPTAAKISDPPISIMTDADTSLGFDTSASATLQRLRDRARKRYGQERIGQGQMPPRTMTQQSYGHGRDISRQSRMSRASTVGTFASIATRFTEGSFGATGGVRAKVAKKLGGKSSKSLLVRAREIKVEHLRHGRTMSSKGGVLPGTVGTSAGGTRWVGQSFEVGKRFWQVLESREEELRGDTIEEEALEEERLDVADKRAMEAASIRRAVDLQHARQAALHRSPEAVLDSFAKEAKGATLEKSQDQTTISPIDQVVDRKGTSSIKAIAPSKSNGVNAASKAQVRAMERQRSEASLISISHEKEVSRPDIENRRGWSDVVSFITAKTSVQSGDEATKGTKKGGALDDTPSRQNEKETTEQEALSVSEAPKHQEEAIMSAKQAITHPEAPLGVEEKFPLATFELLRRTSNPGVRPAQERGDAASDFEVAARPVSQSPQMLTPNEASCKWDRLHSSGNTNRLRTNSANSWDGRLGATSPTSSTPLLRKRASAIGIVLRGESETSVDHNTNINGKTSILRDVGFDVNALQKKSVQFQGSNSLAPPLVRNLLRSSPTKEMEGMTLLAGRARNVVMGDAAPAPPQEVLSRNATPDGLSTPLLDSLVSTPAGAKAEDMITTRSILRRDRMLVRLAWSPSDNLPKDFSERDSRRYPIYSEPFKEYMVVYRTGRLELWEDPSLMSKCLGHSNDLKLSMAVSLKRGKAFVSTYSYIDRIFCLTFTKDDDSHHRLLHLRKSGTCIWFFDARSITVGADWMWELWRELGGVIPQNLDVHIPAFSVRIRIPVPEEVTAKDTASMDSKSASYFEGGEGFKLLTPASVKDVIRKVIKVQPEWGQLCQGVELSGLQFELAWRSGPTLNWVKEDRTPDGQRRDWCVLVGSIVSEPQRPSILEYRPAFHYPTSVRMPKGDTMKEPCGVEGFLWRVKAVSGSLTRLYVTTHDGLIFVNRSSKAFPPDRHLAAMASEVGPIINDQSKNATSGMDQIDQERRRKRDAIRGRKRSAHREESLAELRKDVMATLVEPPITEEEIDAQIETYRAFEKRRLFEQIVNCDGYVDMRDVVEVRSMGDESIEKSSNDEKDKDEKKSTAAAASSNDHALASQSQNGGSVNEFHEEEEEEEDLGGEEGLALAKDRIAMKKSRQFEVVLTNGRSVQLEAYSKSVAKEWISRLTELVTYWNRRDKVDALELMTASGLSPALIGKRTFKDDRDHRAMDHSTEGERLYAVVGNLWHWCVHQSCRSILKAGRLFQKKKAFSGFYSRYYILTAGRLIHFKLMTSTATARARQNSGIFHKRQETVVHLRDAYVYSGQLTEDMLVNGRSEGAGSINTYGIGTGGAANSDTRHTLPRVYADGMISFDDDEDCTFIIRYRPQRLNQAADPSVKVGISDTTTQASTPASTTSIPALGDATYNSLVLRARSKIERNLWVRAINIECERLNRLDREREDKIRNQGQTPWKSSWHH